MRNTLDSLHHDLMSLRNSLRSDIVRLEAKIDGMPSLRELWKAVAALVIGAAVFAGGVLAVASWWPPAPQTVNVRIEGKMP